MVDYVQGTSGSDFIILTEATLYNAGGSSDFVVGSDFNDSINGAGGDDLIFGGGGKDVLTGGAGADVMTGGSGNDAFVFNSGDLVHNTGLFNGHLGLVDTITDFHGAGGYKAYTGVEDDFLIFSGYGQGSSISFVKNVGNATNQLYYITDTANPAHSGYVLIHMADGTAHLATGDYSFISPVSVVK